MDHNMTKNIFPVSVNALLNPMFNGIIAFFNISHRINLTH